MYAPVRAFLLEEGMRGEGMSVAVLEDEIASRVQDILCENLVRERLEPFQRIRRVSKDDVELLPADGQEVEDVVTYHRDVAQSEPLRLGLDERGIGALHLHAIDA